MYRCVGTLSSQFLETYFQDTVTYFHLERQDNKVRTVRHTSSSKIWHTNGDVWVIIFSNRAYN